jgi:hypothetical protein
MGVGIGWNAGVVRARLLGRRRLGARAWRDLAELGSLDAALQELRGGPYGHDVHADMTLEAAQWAVAATPLWHLRVLAGWLPPAGADLVRVLAGWWEVLNVENLLAGLAGGRELPPYVLGRLDTAWDRIRAADSVGHVRSELAASDWLDPGGEDPGTIVTWLRLSWAHRVAQQVDPAARLAAGWGALVVAQDLLVGSGTRRGGRPRRMAELGWRWARAEDLGGLLDGLPRDAAWVLRDVSGPEELWRAEARWWRQLDEGGRDRLRRADSGPDVVVGAFAALLADAHGVQAALQLAAHGGVEEEVARVAL